MANQKPHAIMISFHLQGHIIPFVNLALNLASKGFSITFAHLDHIHHQISRSNPQTPQHDIFSRSGLDIHYTTLSDGYPVDFDRAADFNLHLHNFLHRLPDRVDELVAKIKARPEHSHSHYFLIADTFCVWAEKIARKYSLVNVSFWTEPALVFSLYYHWDLLRESGHVPVGARPEIVDYLPGIKSINTKDFMSYFHEPNPSLMHEIISRAFDAVKRADFILCNTVEELEQETISALKQKHRFYAIGPVFPTGFPSPVAKSLLPESDISGWLNSKTPGSVLYVSFGSLAKTDRNVISELAGGLLLSQVSFVWVLRPGILGSDAGEILAEGFEDSVGGRGLIVPWCDQTRVLSDQAVGGFLTHCGWNSVLESVWRGIPMLCYPLFTDQITNRKLVVDDWRVGMNLCDGGVVTRCEVEAKIGMLMSGETSDELRREVGNVRRVLRSGLAEDGSSERNFDCFVGDVRDEIIERCKKMQVNID